MLIYLDRCVPVVSVFAEFDLPANDFALADTLTALPEAVIEVERVVASSKLLTPYFWLSNVAPADFETAAETDPSIQNVQRLDSFDEATLFRAEWTQNVASLIYAYTQVGAVILDATGKHDTWEVQLRFDDHDQLTQFQRYCSENAVSFTINRLYEVSHAHTGRQFGLTEKQHEALVTAWNAGFFEIPAEATLTEIAENLDISQQALSQRLRKGHRSLIANTLLTTSPSTE